jgi:D-erythrose 4-phosphate dehydrogenase
MRIGVLGMGRIGRCLLQQLHEKGHAVVGVCDTRLDGPRLARLLRHDSLRGRVGYSARADPARPEWLWLDGHPCQLLPPPARAPEAWRALEVEALVDCTGDEALVPPGDEPPAGARHYLLARLGPDGHPTIILGANDRGARLPERGVLSCGSCTGHCLLPVLRALLDAGFPLVGGSAAVLHPFLSTQGLLDNPRAGQDADASLARAAPLSVLAAPTRLVECLERVLPRFAGRFQAVCLRVPVPAVLTLDVVLQFGKRVRGEDLAQALAQATRTTHAGLLSLLDDPLVSADLIGTPWSAAIDPFWLDPVSRREQRLILGQDNEWAYSRRVVDLLERLPGPGRSA